MKTLGRRCFLSLLVLLAVPAGAARAQDLSPVRGPGADPGRTVALLLSITGRPQGVVSVPVADIRAAASNQITRTLGRAGWTVAAGNEVRAARRLQRVRNGGSIPRGFLGYLASELEVHTLLIANLIVQHDRLIVTARYTDTASAVVFSVQMTEWTFDHLGEANHAAWLSGVRDACAVVAATPVREPSSRRQPALILGAQPVGCSAGEALMASHALLEYYVERGDRAPIDPAVTAATLNGAGHSERYIGATGRRLLIDTFGCPTLLIPQLISYAPARRVNTNLVEYQEYSEQRAPVMSDFAMNLRLIDLASGSIRAGKEVFLAVPSPVGWFGAPRDDTLMKRLKMTATRLWSEMNNDVEEL